MIAGAVVLPKGLKIPGLNDSKQVSAKKREELFDIIKEKAVSYGIGMSSPARIDEINILQATYEAMALAVKDLNVVPDLLLNDAVTIPQISVKQIGIIKGERQKSFHCSSQYYGKSNKGPPDGRICPVISGIWL